MKLLKKIKEKFKKPEDILLEEINIEEIITEAKKSSYKDMNTFAGEQIDILNKLTDVQNKLNDQLNYYKSKKKDAGKFIDKQIASVDADIKRVETLKEEHEKRREARNDKGLKKLVENYSMSKLKRNIMSYGFNFTTSELITYVLVIVGVPIVIGIISKLNIYSLLVLTAAGLICVPPIIFSLYKQRFNESRFEMIIDYLTNILPIFMQKAKIAYALQETRDLVSGKMQNILDDAIRYIQTTTNDPNAESTALQMIEEEFPNSRVIAVHRLMETIETKNSTNYKDTCQNLFVDVESWIRRISEFQKDLKDRRIKILILCIATLMMNLVFVFVYTSSEYFAGFTDKTAYQVSTVMFIISIIAVAVISLFKLNGSWLIDDSTEEDETRIRKAYNTWDQGQQKIKVQEIVMFLLCVASAAYCGIKGNYAVAASLGVMGIIILTNQRRKYKSAFKALKKHFEIEFPSWLRNVTLNLHTQTVLNAIEESQMTCSYPMYRQLEIFNEDVEENPTSIKPFSNLLHDFELRDAQASLKVLYSIQSYGENEIKGQTDALILRNQSMLDKSESLKNQGQLSGVEAIGFLPMLIFSITMIIQMILLFVHMTDMISAVGGF